MKPALLAAVALLSGCALTSKATPIDVRYFSPEAIGALPAPPPRPEGRAEPIPLTLGRITSSTHLRNRIVYRESAFELGAYEDWRWTEYPDVYLRRSLTRALFDERATIIQALGGSTPTLDVELIAFEEVRRGKARSGRVQLAYRLRDDRLVLTSGLVTIERQAPSAGGMAPVVAAVGAALHEATGQVAARVEARLGRPPTDR